MKASYNSVRGHIESAYEIKNGELTLRVIIPANTSATAHIPAIAADAVTESGRPLTKTEGVASVKMENGRAVYALQSGSYTFKGPLTK
jgi:alpha-L-rhamnosidase